MIRNLCVYTTLESCHSKYFNRQLSGKNFVYMDKYTKFNKYVEIKKIQSIFQYIRN